MMKPIIALGFLLLAFALSAAGAQASETRFHEAYGKLPLSFEANRGQADPQVKFLSRGPHHTLFLTFDEAVMVFTKPEPSAKGKPAKVKPAKREKAMQAAFRMRFVGANPKTRLVGLEELPGKANYFIGNDPTKWRTKVPTYAKVRYDDLYPGVDLVYYGDHRQLEYDVVVRPGGDPNRIVLGVQGADRLEVDAQGDLVLRTAAGSIRQRKPVIYQEVNGVRKEIRGGYVLRDTHRVGFRVTAYDPSRPLVIDPVLVYSTYLGGAGNDNASAVAVDAAGNAYVTGITSSTINFPTTAGAFQTISGGGSDAFVTKLNPTGTALVYSTYLGGSDFDTGVGIAVDTSGNAYVTGRALSTNFPTTAGSFQTTLGGGGDVFVTKLNPTGTALVYSTFLGGSDFDNGDAVAVDATGNAYVTGSTSSNNFPTTAGAFQTDFRAGGGDAFVTKLNPTGSALLYSTFLGGSSGDQGFGIAADALGNAYVTGRAFSTDFPTTADAFQPTFGGNRDAFVTKLNPAGSALVYSTYLGGIFIDQGSGIAVDAASNAYVTGVTLSTNFPTTADAFQTTFGGLTDAFVAKFATTATRGTTTGLASSATPSVFGQTVILTATVSPEASASTRPTGTVNFFDDATLLGTGTLNEGSPDTASLPNAGLTVGSHSLSAVYQGDSNFDGSTSAVLAQTVNRASTTTTVTSSAAPSQVGQVVTYTSTAVVISPGSGNPTGTFGFSDSGFPIAGCASVSAVGGQARCAVTYSANGTHSITATYSGDTNIAGSTSPVLGQTVTRCGANLAGCNLKGADFANASFAGANLNAANLKDTNLTGASLAGANLSGVNLKDATLANSDLAGANLSGANLKGANLTGASLVGANLAGANVKGVTWSNTLCPDGTNSDTNGGTCLGHL